MGDLGLQHLSALTSLTYLNLDSRLFSDMGMKHIKGLTNLVVLDLFAAKVSDLGCGYIRSVPWDVQLCQSLRFGMRLHQLGASQCLALATAMAPINGQDRQVGSISIGAGVKHIKGLTHLVVLNQGPRPGLWLHHVKFCTVSGLRCCNGTCAWARQKSW